MLNSDQSGDQEISHVVASSVVHPGCLFPIPLMVSGSEHRYLTGRGSSSDSWTPSRASSLRYSSLPRDGRNSSSDGDFLHVLHGGL